MSAVVKTVIPDPIELTDNAADKVKQLMEDEDNKSLRLRVYVTGGGCSGFQYGFKFDDQVADDDTLVKKQGAEMVVDSLSYQYLVGAEVDYEEGLEGSRFLVKIPMQPLPVGVVLLSLSDYYTDRNINTDMDGA